MKRLTVGVEGVGNSRKVELREAARALRKKPLFSGIEADSDVNASTITEAVKTQHLIPPCISGRFARKKLSPVVVVSFLTDCYDRSPVSDAL
ncbi:hypothetical protein OPV22_031116 [Ensete ventricosum]|uniref:Uncharacterized protein n=1 Tax=Ensete ventricosum TaxID=4639 RepID=A0AAV8PTQ0_ENSVE|nr:hypothetical protein OPV22_031116 [Ensete ventricosum]